MMIHEKQSWGEEKKFESWRKAIEDWATVKITRK